jgi:Zn-dependent peptidase ImmA (M78 family)/transcriptional regulator with XRE-family HTH domain
MVFNGDMLKKARIFRGLTISELAEKIDVSKQAVSQYERNAITPKPSVLFQIITTLRFPKSFFEQSSDNAPKVENTFFRSMRSAKSLDLSTQEVKTSTIVTLYNFLNEYLNFPELKLPVSDPDNIHDPEEQAAVLRASWGLGLGPITNMVGLLENNGIIVSSLKTGTDKIDAFTQIHNTKGVVQYCIVLGTDKDTLVRRNFDAAHELGHIVLHRALANIKELSTEEQKKVEKEANQFAAAFLMPRDSFYSDLINPNDIEDYKRLKAKWKVSIAAMVMRAKHLGRINSNVYQSLMKKISYRGWRKCEPFDNDWQVNKPQTLTGKQIVAELANFGEPLYADDIEDLLSLERGTLTTTEDDVEENLVVTFKDNKRVARKA